MTILVVDDEPGYRLLVKDLLMQHGHDPLTAGNGQEALEKMESVKVDFIISDVYMPVMDGFKFYNSVRSSPRWENIPFLYHHRATARNKQDIFRLTDLFLPASGRAKEVLLLEGAPEEKIAVQMPGIDTSHFQPAEKDRSLLNRFGCREEDY